jgi:hypothetical protein
MKRVVIDRDAAGCVGCLFLVFWLLSVLMWVALFVGGVVMVWQHILA